MTITYTILDGNLGDGWNDNYDAACALAEFTDAAIQAVFPDAEIESNVARNTSGCGPAPDVQTDDVRDEINALATVQWIIESTWTKFLDSPASSGL